MELFIVEKEFHVIPAWEVKAPNRMTILLFELFRNYHLDIIPQDFLHARDLHGTSDRTSPIFAHHCHYFFQGLRVSPLILVAYRLRHVLGRCSR